MEREVKSQRDFHSPPRKPSNVLLEFKDQNFRARAAAKAELHQLINQLFCHKASSSNTRQLPWGYQNKTVTTGDMLENPPAPQDSWDRRGTFTGKPLFVSKSHFQSRKAATGRTLLPGRRCRLRTEDAHGNKQVYSCAHPWGWCARKRDECGDTKHIQWAQRSPYLGTHRGMSYALKHLNHCSLF